MTVHISGKPEFLEGKDGIHILIVKALNRGGPGHHKEYHVRESQNTGGLLAKFYDLRLAKNFAHEYEETGFFVPDPHIHVETPMFSPFTPMVITPPSEPYVDYLPSECYCGECDYCLDAFGELNPIPPVPVSEEEYLVRRGATGRYVSDRGWSLARENASRFTLEDAAAYQKASDYFMVLELA